MKVDDANLLAFVLKNDSEVQAVNISTDKNFFAKCGAYHDLSAYPNIAGLNADGKYLWRDKAGNYKIVSGRTRPDGESTLIRDDGKLSEIRQELSVELGNKLITPIERFIGSSKYWIISPDAELNVIPFEALTRNGKPLIESVDVSYVPSLAVLNMMKKHERKNAYFARHQRKRKEFEVVECGR